MNTEILKLDPGQVSAYTRQGMCHLVADDLDAAEKDFRRAVELAPRDATAKDWLKKIPDIRTTRASKLPPLSPSPARGLGHHSVYVFELDTAVLEIRKFREANPIRDPSKPCVYVGLTGLTPEERFENHKRGYKSNRYAKKYGLRLLPHLHEHLNPMPEYVAILTESQLARELRWRGYAVWSN